MINILDARKRNFENLLDDLIYKRKSKANFNWLCEFDFNASNHSHRS